jgi:adenosylhomocysteine nucleosidase
MSNVECRMMKPACPVLVCFALPQEARPFRRECNGREEIRVILTGIGRRNTERAVNAALAEMNPSRVLTCGFAGGLDPALTLNTIVCESSDAALAGRLSALGATPVRFHCADRMAVTPEEKLTLRQQTGAGAVEMESHWIHELCRGRQLTCATVRVISDTATETMPLDFNKVTTSEMKLSLSRLAVALLAAPNKVPALLRLQRQTQAAADTLATFLHRVTAD